MTNVFIVLQTTLWRGEKKCVLRYSAKRILLYYSVIVTNVLALETNALKAPVKTSAPHSYTCSYQRFSSRTCHEIATHRHSPSKTGGSHAPVLTCEYATPTSYSIYAIAFSAFKLTKLIVKTINKLLLTLLAACTTRVQYPGVA